jgi:hypothetical protein
MILFAWRQIGNQSQASVSLVGAPAQSRNITIRTTVAFTTMMNYAIFTSNDRLIVTDKSN